MLGRNAGGDQTVGIELANYALSGDAASVGRNCASMAILPAKESGSGWRQGRHTCSVSQVAEVAMLRVTALKIRRLIHGLRRSPPASGRLGDEATDAMGGAVVVDLKSIALKKPVRTYTARKRSCR